MSNNAVAAIELDPRIAATGGYRRVNRDPKSNYEWPGMMRSPDWQQTTVHRRSSYGCARCGKRFATPHAAYTHLAKLHPATGFRRLSRPLTPSEAIAKGNGRLAELEEDTAA